MMTLMAGSEQLEREFSPPSERIAPAVVSTLVLHGFLFCGILFSGILSGLFHHNYWGNPGAGSAIQVSLVSNALPLPADHPTNKNVLSTETPSEAPAPPAPKAARAIDDTAIPIPGKETKAQKQPQTTPKTQPHQPQIKQDNRAAFGEQSGMSMSRSTMAQTASVDSPVSVSNGDFGTRFPWYVDGIKRKVGQNWFRGQVDPRTPKGAVVQIYFKVSRQGAPSGFRVATASGSPTLDQSCLLATRRVDTFGDLPPDSRDQWLDVTYDCTY